MKPSELEMSVLMGWRWTGDDCNVLSFWKVHQESEVAIHKVRRAVRALARKGYLEYARMSWNDEGEFTGAGYKPTISGYTLIHAELARIDAS